MDDDVKIEVERNDVALSVDGYVVSIMKQV